MDKKELNEEKPTRKQNRLNYFDYSSYGAYFLTVCTSKRINCFWVEAPFDVGASIARPLDPQDVGASIARPLDPQNIKLSKYGKIVDEAVKNISVSYPALSVDHYVIMPDHIHLLITIHADERGRPMVAPTVSRVVQQMKGYVTKRIGVSIWQKSFYDHVIRNKEDYEAHIKYIYENPFGEKPGIIK